MNTASPFGSQFVSRTPEIARIAALPRRVWSEESSQKLAELLTRELKAPGGTMSLRPVQAVALYEAMECGGLFGPMRVGSGKTLCTALLPVVLEAKRPILLLPAALVEKTAVDFKMLREHWRIATNLQLISYESLGLVQSAHKLAYIQPDLIVADECHKLKNHGAGRTRRVIRFMHEYPETRFVGVSGTVMKGSVRDFAHLLRWALKDRAPIPVTDDEVESWADSLDEKVNPLSRRRPEALFDLRQDHDRELVQLLDEHETDDLTRARRVFQSRLLETRGVVASSRTDGVTCSLRVSALEYQPSTVIEEHFQILQTRWETPCGKAFSEAAEMRMYTRELALGFSYTWIPKEKSGEWDALVLGHQNAQRQIGVGVKPTQSASSSLSSDVHAIPNASLTRSTGCASTVTESRPENMLRSLRDRAAGVKSATEGVPVRSQSTSTTTTLPEEFEGFSVLDAIEHSACSEIALGLSEPLLIFLERNRPPTGWLNARREWCSFVREQIAGSQKYDTMLQVANACRAGLLDSRTLDAWTSIASSYVSLTRPIFYDMAALEACLRWIEKNIGIVWVEHRAFGELLSRLSDVPYFGPGGLSSAGASIVSEKANRSIIASVAACGQGFNLQMFSTNLVTSCPPNAAIMEQLIGRTHRDGQEADEVAVDILLGCREHHDAFQRALEGARAAADTLGHDQKLLLADIVMPNINNRRGPLWA